jgi:tripartite-type tricarboxylate transporter receptor subunit TctC
MEKRHPKFPDVPTFKELGYDLVSGAYRGIAVPKDTPKEIQAKLSEMIAKINANPEFKKRMENDGMALLDVNYVEYSDFVNEKAGVYIEAAKEAGVIK